MQAVALASTILIPPVLVALPQRVNGFLQSNVKVKPSLILLNWHLISLQIFPLELQQTGVNLADQQVRWHPRFGLGMISEEIPPRREHHLDELPQNIFMATLISRLLAIVKIVLELAEFICRERPAFAAEVVHVWDTELYHGEDDAEALDHKALSV